MIDTEPAVEVHRPLTLSAAESTDPDGGVAAYHWDFGDGNTAIGIEVAHIWREAGLRSVTLTVDDGKGLENSRHAAHFEVDVTSAPPVEIAVSPITCPGETLAFDLANLPDTVDPETPRWEFGDRTVLAGKQTTHAYARPGTYSVSVATPVDRSGIRLVTPFARNVTVNRRPVALFKALPVADAGPDVDMLFGRANDSLVLDAGRSSDPDGDTLIYYWTLSNGVEVDGEKARIEFSESGEVTVTLTAADPHGLDCSVTEDTVTIRITQRERSTPLTE